MYIPEMYYHLTPDELRDKIRNLEGQLHAEQDKSIVMSDAIRSALEFIDELPVAVNRRNGEHHETKL